jgi:hypothetical protein
VQACDSIINFNAINCYFYTQLLLKYNIWKSITRRAIGSLVRNLLFQVLKISKFLYIGCVHEQAYLTDTRVSEQNQKFHRDSQTTHKYSHPYTILTTSLP